jgi:hypothetical protein
MEPIITRKISSFCAACTPEWDVVSYGTCRDEVLNNMAAELAAELTLDDNREFDKISGGDATARDAADGLDIEFGIQLFGKDGDEWRGVEDHLGSPRSS